MSTDVTAEVETSRYGPLVGWFEETFANVLDSSTGGSFFDRFSTLFLYNSVGEVNDTKVDHDTLQAKVQALSRHFDKASVKYKGQYQDPRHADKVSTNRYFLRFNVFTDADTSSFQVGYAQVIFLWSTEEKHKRETVTIEAKSVHPHLFSSYHRSKLTTCSTPT